jgi:dihydropteroate synthase
MILALTDAQALDDTLSNRFIELDPSGYFLIYLDRGMGHICADLYSNTINDRGLACDPETGEPLPCTGKLERKPIQLFRGRTAKELCIEIFEKPSEAVITRLDHAAYLGRELLRAEIALYNGADYIQD